MNNRTSYVLRYGKIVEERWHKVSVGDIVKLKNNDFVAVSITHSFCLFFFFLSWLVLVWWHKGISYVSVSFS